MDVTRLDYPDRYFDGAVATFLFCTLPDELQVPALKELSRVVKIGGLIRLLEYTRPSGAVWRAITKIWDPGCIGPMGQASTAALRNTFQRRTCNWSILSSSQVTSLRSLLHARCHNQTETLPVAHYSAGSATAASAANR
jgi:ubiquinone/menaquinone biosynthesis C-methylase UbiE